MAIMMHVNLWAPGLTLKVLVGNELDGEGSNPLLQSAHDDIIVLVDHQLPIQCHKYQASFELLGHPGPHRTHPGTTLRIAHL